MWHEEPFAPAIAAIAAGSFKRRDPPAIRGGGYVVASLEAALWASHRSDSFRDGALLAVNLGDDADTTGAVYGQLAGALYGESGIPGAWLQVLARRELITSFAETAGFAVLREMGMEDFAFEVVVLKYPELFSDEAVRRSQSCRSTRMQRLTARSPLGWVHSRVDRGGRRRRARGHARGRPGVTRELQWRVCWSPSRKSHMVFSQLEIRPLSPHTRHAQAIAFDSGTM
jgi:hypothetical protein